jgi:hypothetical protein
VKKVRMKLLVILMILPLISRLNKKTLVYLQAV